MQNGYDQKGRAIAERTIQRARELASLMGAEAKEDPVVSCLLNEYGKAIRASREIMERSGMVRICSTCAENVSGGCCFREVEEWYDPVLLLANILMGAALPDGEVFSERCIFLGQRGCTIPARYHFCVNYLCEKLRKGIRPEVMKEVSETIGREISNGAELEYGLRRFISSKGITPD